jgi:hypothetical protein
MILFLMLLVKITYLGFSYLSSIALRLAHIPLVLLYWAGSVTCAEKYGFGMDRPHMTTLSVIRPPGDYSMQWRETEHGHVSFMAGWEDHVRLCRYIPCPVLSAVVLPCLSC